MSKGPFYTLKEIIQVYVESNLVSGPLKRHDGGLQCLIIQKIKFHQKIGQILANFVKFCRKFDQILSNSVKFGRKFVKFKKKL